MQYVGKIVMDEGVREPCGMGAPPGRRTYVHTGELLLSRMIIGIYVICPGVTRRLSDDLDKVIYPATPNI